MTEERKEKTRTTIDIDRQVWSEIKKEVYEKGQSVSQVVEKRLTKTQEEI